MIMFNRRDGFTIVEIIVVIVTIAILAAISTVAYVGIKEKAVASSLMSDLDSAKKSLDMKSFVSAVAPELPDSYHPSKGNHVEMVKIDLPYYKDMTPVQNGVLFFDICNSLIDDGYGKGVNQGGTTEKYITSCDVDNNNMIQIKGWTGTNLSVPVQSNKLQQIADGLHYTDTWSPERESSEKLFYTTLNSRFVAQGGEYPITSFFDGVDWADPRYHVVIEDLPDPTPRKDKYCIEAYNDSYPDMYYMIVNGETMAEGRCPSIQ